MMNEINKEHVREHVTDIGPSKKRYKDDNLRRAQELTSMFSIGEQFDNYDYQALQSLQSEQSERRDIERQQYNMWLVREKQNGHQGSYNNYDNGDADSHYWHDLHVSRGSRDAQNLQNSRRASCPYRHEKRSVPSLRPTRLTRPIRAEFSEKEKAEILSRVMFVGIERAALEAGTSKEIIMRWLQLIDESISEISSAWDDIDVAMATTAESIAGYETEYKRILEHRSHYKKPLEQIIDILARAEEVGTQQAARELRSTRTDIIRWRRMFPKQIWEQLRLWVKENDIRSGQDDGQDDYQQVTQTAQVNIPVSVYVPEIIIARADEVGDEQAAHEFKISAATMKRLRLQVIQAGQVSSNTSDDSSNPANLQKLKWHTREERLEILARADAIGINKAAAETGICTSTITRWRKELGQHKYVICTSDQKAVILARADEIGDKGAAAEFKVSVGSIVTWRRKTGQIKHRIYTSEEKTKILARADEIGAKQAAVEFKINVGTVSEWRKEAGCVKKHSQEEKAAIVARSNEVGIKQAASEAGISPNTIILWRSKLGVVKHRKNLNADERLVERLVIWNRANEVGRLQAAREYGISPVTIGNWDWKFGMKNPPLYGPSRASRD